MKKLFTYLAYLQFPFFGVALFFYLQPFWTDVSPMGSVNKGLLFTGVALSFGSLITKKNSLKPSLQKTLLWMLLPTTLFMFLLSAFWLVFYPGVADFAGSLMVLSIGMLSIIKLIVD